MKHLRNKSSMLIKTYQGENRTGRQREGPVLGFSVFSADNFSLGTGMAFSDPLWLHVCEKEGRTAHLPRGYQGVGKEEREEFHWGILFGLLFLLHESSLLGPGEAEDNLNQGYQDDFLGVVVL